MVLDKNQFSSLPDYTDDISKLASDFNQYYNIYIEKIDEIREMMPQNWKEHPVTLFSNLNQPLSRKLMLS